MRSSEEFILDKIKTKHSDYDNTFHKWIYDYGIADADNPYLNSIESVSHNINDPKYLDKFAFIDFTDGHTISKIKSTFLSSSSLPNILQFSKLQSFKDLKCSIGDKVVEDAFRRCVDEGFLEKDETLDIYSLTKKSSEQLIFPAIIMNRIAKSTP